MKTIVKCLITAALVFAAATAHADGRSVYVANSSFDDYLASWTYEGDGVSADKWGVNGENDIQLKLWLDNAPYTAAHKTLYGLAPGKYEVSAYVRGGGSGSAYMYARSGGKTVKNTEYSGTFEKRTLTAEVLDGKLEIGFAAENGNKLWYNADDVSVSCAEEYAVDGGALENNSFESGLGDFKVSKNAAVSENGRTGNCLYIPSGDTAAVKLDGIESGFYEASMYCKSSSADSVAAVSDGTHEARARIPYSTEWKRVIVSGVYCENGALDISVTSGGELYIDDVCVRKVDKYRNFITGGDITEANYLKDKGARYYSTAAVDGVDNTNDKPDDCVKILADNGVNMARVRVYNKTGRETATDKGYGTFYLPDGYQDKADALKLCKRAKENGMGIEFTFHYSDFWTNGDAQEIPMDWRALIAGETDEEKIVSILEKSVYEYTLDVMTALKNQGTLPELVSVGNEIQCGMLYPYGNVSENGANWKNLARFLNAGYRAVKEVSPSSRVILHLDECGNFAKYEEFFGQCERNSISYDIIGTSYYPYWAKTGIEHAAEFCNTVTERFDKDIIIMETGYNFHPTRPDGYPGQLENNGAYEDIYPATPEGHKRFIADLFNGLKSVPRCIGDLYWDPIMINCDGVGWAVKADENDAANDCVQANVVSNTTLFDFDGHALPSLGVFAGTIGANYSADVCVLEVRNRFDAVEKNGRVHITNKSDKAENIVIYSVRYNDGWLDRVDIDKRELKPGEDADFENGRCTFVWTKDDIQPITRRIDREVK